MGGDSFRWTELSTQVKKSFKEVSPIFTVTIDRDKCDGCGECTESCPADILEMEDGISVVTDPEECLGCESCVAVCPTGAITVEEN